jgi:hypothetical protein
VTAGHKTQPRTLGDHRPISCGHFALIAVGSLCACGRLRIDPFLCNAPRDMPDVSSPLDVTSGEAVALMDSALHD